MGTQWDKHSETELINSTQHWTDEGINKVKVGPVAAGQAVRPANHAAFSVWTEGGLFSLHTGKSLHSQAAWYTERTAELGRHSVILY